MHLNTDIIYELVTRHKYDIFLTALFHYIQQDFKPLDYKTTTGMSNNNYETVHKLP